MTNANPDHLVRQPSGVGWRVTAVAVALGTTSLVTQVILLREFLSVFYGNELVVGVLLANWMLLTGLGSYLGRFVSRVTDGARILIALPLLLGTVPLFTVFLLRLLKNVVFPVGAMVGFVPMIWSSFILLIPYCILSGISFTLLSALAPGNDRKSIAAVYAREATGSLAGGIAYSLVLIFILSTFQSLAALMAFNFAVALAIARDKSSVAAFVWLLLIVFLVPSLVLNLDIETKRFLFPEQEILYSKDTPYGNLTVSRQSGQVNFYENNVLLSSTGDVAGSEEPVHYAMVQHPGPRSVLMISGALSGAAREVYKYGVERLEYVEVNPSVIEVAKRYTDVLSNGRITVINQDPRLFVREPGTSYDVILLNELQPATVQANRYYTVEFFEGLRKRMNPGGVLSFGLLPAADYQSEDARRINSTMMNTLKSLFKEVLIVPALKTCFLASDAKLDIRIGKLVEHSGINNTYVNRFYLDDEDLARRSELIHRSLSADAPVNRDFTPVSYYRQIVYWLSYFRSTIWVVAILVLALLVGVTTKLNAISAGVFTGGFAASSIEILLLLAFQILFGYVYQALAVIITVFMAGLAAGSYLRARIIPRPGKNTYVWIQVAIAVYCFLLPLILHLTSSVQSVPIIVHAAFFLLTFIIAALIGLEFSIASVLRQGGVKDVASELYGVDLIGSALGALLVATFFIPVLGFFAVSLAAGSLSLISALVAFVNKKEFDISNA
ncbi:hypothetical protein D4R75_02625 [bacterium]|nr:MAG: hypothetical protein D4R75_02625 [bacterium]